MRSKRMPERVRRRGFGDLRVAYCLAHRPLKCLIADMVAPLNAAARIDRPFLRVRRGKAALFQWVQAPPGNRSSRKQPEQSWR